MDELLSAAGIEIGNPDKDKVFLRSLTDHYVGRLVAIDLVGKTAVLTDAAWVADSGRLSEFFAKGKTSDMEIEPVGTVMHAYCGLLPWPHPLFAKAV